MKNSVKVILAIAIMLNIGAVIYAGYQKKQADQALRDSKMYQEMAEVNENKAIKCQAMAEKQMELAAEARDKAKEQFNRAQEKLRDK